MNREELATKSLEELRDIAAKLNVKVHHLAKEDTIINQIMQQPVAFVSDAMQHPAQKPVAPVHNNTPEAVLTAIKHFVEKEGFEAKFPSDGTWVFRYKGAEDSGNLSIPMRVIVQKAEMVSRGKRSLLGFKDGNEIVMWG